MRRLARAARTELKGLLFVLPWIIGFIAFTAYPIGASFYYSLTRYDVLRPPKYIGLDNYYTLLTRDPTMGITTRNTLWWVAIAVPFGIAGSFVLANFLNASIRARSVFRAIFYFPSLVPAIVSAVIWQWLLNTQWGLINTFLASSGLRVIPFLGNPALAKPTLTAIHLWAQGGTIVIYLAALQDVPRHLYDAAMVDGANAWQRFRHITIPMCTPATLFLLITGIVGGFQNFTFPWLLTGGGPNQATLFYAIYLYQNAFRFLKMGYGAAMAWLLFLLAVIVSLLVFRSSARWVYYGAD